MALDLHTHLEGWVRPATAAELARDAGVPTPPGGWDRALRMDAPADLTVFLAHVAAAYPVLGSADALRRVAREAVEDAAADGCEYLEMRFGPSTHRRPGFDLDAVIAAVCDGLAEGSGATGLASGLVVCLLRHDDDATNLAVARAAAARAGSGVVGLDVAGDELIHPSIHPYREPYAVAAAAGLGLTAHAAEAGPASSVIEAVEGLGVRRIGHGSHAVEDPAVLAWAADHDVTFEICPTSNVLTGAAPSIRDHPLHAFLAAGVALVLGDDDPVTTGSTLADEERRLVDDGGLSVEDVAVMRRRSIEVGFMDEGVRARLRAASLLAPGPDAPPLDGGTAIHDDLDPGRGRDRRRLPVHDPELEPQAARTGGDRLVRVGDAQFGASEDVDHVERAGRVDGLRQRPIRGDPEDVPLVRVHGHALEALVDEVAEHPE